MTERRSLQALDRLIRVREIRARQALAAAGRAETRRQAEAALVLRVERLIASTPAMTGDITAQAASARAAGDGVLGALADAGRPGWHRVRAARPPASCATPSPPPTPTTPSKAGTAPCRRPGVS
jgi:hypothetical protein